MPHIWTFRLKVANFDAARQVSFTTAFASIVYEYQFLLHLHKTVAFVKVADVDSRLRLHRTMSRNTANLRHRH